MVVYGYGSLLPCLYNTRRISPKLLQRKQRVWTKAFTLIAYEETYDIKGRMKGGSYFHIRYLTSNFIAEFMEITLITNIMIFHDVGKTSYVFDSYLGDNFRV